MELSINFIVVLILSIVMFGMGITLTYKIISGANEIHEELSEQIKQQIEDEMMRSGSTINIPESTKEINKGEHDVFAIGMRNTHTGTGLNAAVSFKIQITPWKAFKDDKTTICDTSAGDDCKIKIGNWWVNTDKVYKIEKNKIVVGSIFFNVPKKYLDDDENIMPGTYIFMVDVNALKKDGATANPKILGSTKIYITVKR